MSSTLCLSGAIISLRMSIDIGKLSEGAKPLDFHDTNMLYRTRCFVASAPGVGVEGT